MPENKHKQSTPLGGRLCLFRDFWRKITRDKVVLSCVDGLKIDFTEEIKQNKVPREIVMNNEEIKFVDKELLWLIKENIVEKVNHVLKNGWISNIFLRPKKDGSFRMILNLKPLNKFIKYEKFKMEGINEVIRMIQKDMKMISIDLKQAYFHVKISEKYQKYMTFSWKNQLYKFKVLPNGLASGPRLFVKLTKAISTNLRKNAVDILIYIDDTFLCAKDATLLERNKLKAIQVFENCGFTVNWKKSCLTPSTQLEFLGFLIDSSKMEIRLMDRKRKIIDRLGRKILKSNKVMIRFLAKMIGVCVTTFPASKAAQLNYREMERFKTKMLIINRKNWNAKVRLDRACKKEIAWWVDNIFSSKFTKSLKERKINFHLYTDSSKTGWGCSINNTEFGANGKFSEEDCNKSINSKELLAIWYGLRCFKDKFKGKKVLILTDNKTALSCIVKRGTQQKFRDYVTRQIYKLADNYEIELCATFVPGKDNYFADRKSSIYMNPRCEWALADKTMQFIADCSEQYRFDIDLFASHLNVKHKRYVSWQKDPGSLFVDAFKLD